LELHEETAAQIFRQETVNPLQELVGEIILLQARDQLSSINFELCEGD
jgi:hypothetical protein